MTRITHVRPALAGFANGLVAGTVDDSAGQDWVHGYRRGVQARWMLTFAALFVLWGLAGGLDRQAGL